MLLPHTKIETDLLSNGAKFIVGIDEAGRGPLAGPVVSAAAMIHPGMLELEFENRQLIRDSKTLSAKQRETVYKFIMGNELFTVGIGEVSPAMIDKMNILNATLLSMKVALEDLLEKAKDRKIILDGKDIRIVVDGNRKIPKLKFEQHLFPKGDRNIFSIAVASICAKVHRDRLMKQYHRQYPDYGFDVHKGYGTKVHMDCLEKLGPCEIHRRSFAPVRNSE